MIMFDVSAKVVGDYYENVRKEFVHYCTCITCTRRDVVGKLRKGSHVTRLVSLYRFRYSYELTHAHSSLRIVARILKTLSKNTRHVQTWETPKNDLLRHSATVSLTPSRGLNYFVFKNMTTVTLFPLYPKISVYPWSETINFTKWKHASNRLKLNWYRI